jgi:hypothetical protein
MARRYDGAQLFQSPTPKISDATRRIIRGAGLPDDIAVHLERFLLNAAHLRQTQPAPIPGRTHKQAHHLFISIKKAAKRLNTLLQDEHVANVMLSHEANLFRAKLKMRSSYTVYMDAYDQSTRIVQKRIRRYVNVVEDIYERANKIADEQKNKPKRTLRNAAKINRAYYDESIVIFWNRWIGTKIEFKKGSRFVTFFDVMDKELCGDEYETTHLDTLKERFARIR